MSGITITADSGTQFETGAAEYNSIDRLDDNNYVIAYRDNNDFNYGKVNVGSRTGTSVTISEANAVTFNSGATTFIEIRSLSSTSFVISYCDTSSDKVYVIAGTISGVVITLGTAVEAWNFYGSHGTTVAVLDNANFIVSFFASRSGVGNYGISCKVGAISGTTITLGTKQEMGFDGNYSKSYGCDSTHFVITYWSSGVTAIAGTADIVAQTVTFGAANTLFGDMFTGEYYSKIGKFDSTHFIVGARREIGSPTWYTTCAIFINLTTLTVTTGAAVTITDSIKVYPDLCAISSSNYLLSYYVAATNKAYVRAGTLTGDTTIAWDVQGEVVFDNSTSAYTTPCRLTDDYFIIGYKSG